MLFEYYGKVIVQPRRDLFSKTSSLRVSKSSDTGFMTRVEADAAMELAKQAELLSVHADRSAPTGKPPFNKKGKGGGKGGGNRKVPLRLLPLQHQQQHQQQQPQQRQQQQQQQPSASPSATPAGSPRQRQSTLPRTNPNKGGKGGKGKGQ